MASPSTGNTALIFGASGITGWAITLNALTYPSPSAFTQIIGLTQRPLPAAISQLPTSSKISLYSGIDLSASPEHLRAKLEKVSQIQDVTHVYYAAYTGHGTDFQELKRQNMKILVSAVEAVEKLCPKMQFITLQTGGKAYGIEFVDHIELRTPSKETDPRIPEPYASNIFYYAQVDYLTQQSRGKPWSFCEIRPDVIVGFAPNHNAMNICQCLGLFLTCWHAQHGEWAPVPFPGKSSDIAAWSSKRCDTSQDVLARFHLYASLHSDKTAGRVFNVADGDVVTWRETWEGICGYFRLKGVPPNGGVTGEQWMLDNKGKWEKWETETGMKKGMLGSTNWSFMSAVMGGKEGESVDRQYDLSASHEIGFADKVNTVAGYHIAFDRMRKANLIP